MKKLVFALMLLVFLVVLFGCTQTQDNNLLQPNVGRSPQNTNNPNPELVLLEKELSNCLKEKEECENLPDLNCPVCEKTNCPNCPVCKAVTDCGSVATALGNQLTECSAQKNSLENSFDDCNKEKSTCNAELDLANKELEKVLKMEISHYVKGNFYVSEGYRVTQAFTSKNNEKIIVGLEYDGGSDYFFNPGLVSGLTKWYVLTRNESGGYDPKIVKSVYESDAGDTVLIGKAFGDPNVDYLKIKATEFDAATSKEGLNIKKIIVMYTYRENP